MKSHRRCTACREIRRTGDRCKKCGNATYDRITAHEAFDAREATTPEGIILKIHRDLGRFASETRTRWTERTLESLGLEVPDNVLTLLEKADLSRVRDVLYQVCDKREALNWIPGITDKRASLFAEQLHASYESWASLQTADAPPARKPSRKPAAAARP